MTEDDNTPPGKGNGKDRGHIVFFPSAEERERKRREKQEIEEQKKHNEKLWQKAYRDRQKGEKVPFFTERAKQIPPFAKYSVLTLVIIHVLTNLLPADVHSLMILHFSFIPAVYTGGMDWQWSALVSPLTSLLLHIGWMHLAMNGFMLLVMGTFFERTFGSRRALLFFIVCGLSGNLLFFLIHPMLLAPVVGASGAIDGFFAVFLILNWSRLPVAPHLRKRGYAPLLLFWCGLTIVMGLIFPQTAWEAHLGGLLAGWGIFELWKRGKLKI
ncbi:MAG: rhomboid family intramembrane serine protease [Alphaproteobacteria bacterium]|nr:rhomboid family intramembrane serine protease [Alphaproteobacteria bacterium]